MLAFVHLLVGLYLGIIFARLSKDIRMIPISMCLSLVPDLLDKSVSLIYSPLNSGRTVGHTLLFSVAIAVFILVVSILYRHKWFVWGAAVSACAILLHQIFDSMWALPTTWFYPLYGAFIRVNGLGGVGRNWFLTMFLQEINSPLEWISAILIIITLIVYCNHMKDEIRDVVQKWLRNPL